MTADEPHKKVIESIHTRDGTYCVDVILAGERFALQTCRRDEERWQVLDNPGDFATRAEAVTSALTIIAGFQ